MSIQLKEPTLSAELLPDWFMPPPGGWTADDLDRLPPEAPQHIELIDGALIVVSPHRSFHSRVMLRLGSALDLAAPEGIGVEIEMAVKLGQRQRPEPDILAFRTSDRDNDRTFYLPEEVLLVVEIVSEESAERDRETKPLKYAKAEIPHFWRVEEDDSGFPVVYVYELDPATGQYVPTTIAHDRLTVSVPFDIDVDLRRLVR